MANGEGCECWASSEWDCCCDGVDWRSLREVELEEFVKELSEKLEQLRTKQGGE